MIRVLDGVGLVQLSTSTGVSGVIRTLDSVVSAWPMTRGSGTGARGDREIRVVNRATAHWLVTRWAGLL